MIFLLQQSTNLWKGQNVRTHYTLDMRKVGRLDSLIIISFYRNISGSTKTIRENALHISQRNCTLIHLCGQFCYTFKLIWQHSTFKSSLPWHVSHSYTNNFLFISVTDLVNQSISLPPTLLLCPLTLFCLISIIYYLFKKTSKSNNHQLHRQSLLTSTGCPLILIANLAILN